MFDQEFFSIFETIPEELSDQQKQELFAELEEEMNDPNSSPAKIIKWLIKKLKDYLQRV